MTDAEKDAAWRSLPDDFKDEVKRRYAPFANWGDDCRCINTEVLILEDLFGKHNLTASEEEKPRFSKGDIVIYVGADNPDCKGSIFAIDGDIYFNDYYKCLMASSISNVMTHICNVSLTDLSPYTDEQEPSIEAEKIRKAEEELQERKAEYLDRMLYHEKNCTYETTLDKVNPDWLAYRMELAKAITPTLIAYCDSDATPTGTIDVVMQIVNGIVERLKGGDK